MLNPEDRYRKKVNDTRNRILKNIIIISLLCGISYKIGYESVKSRETAYKTQMNIVSKDRSELEQIITSLRSDLQSSKLRYKILEEKYNNEIPTGNFKILSDLLKRQLDAGISVKRLHSTITSARPPKNCTKARKKRFVMRTPVYKGAHGEVSFANGAIRISGDGEAAINSSGKLEAWYDPGKKVKITFETTGGEKIVKNNLLPIYHSVVIGDKEYRFTISKGERSFINVTSDSCDYP